MSAPQHHGRDMYRDVYRGQDMKRWICTEPGCASAISDETLAAVADMAFAFDNGIQLPGTTIIGIPDGVCPGCNGQPAAGQKWCQRCIDEANAMSGEQPPGITP